MRRNSAAEDIAQVGELRTRVAKLLEQLDGTRHPIVVKQDGKSAAGMATPEESERLAHEEYEEMVREKIREGLESLVREPTISPEDAKKYLFAVIARVARQ